MDYFLLKQDERYTNTPRLKNIFEKIDVRNINLLKAHKIPKVTIFQVSADDNCDFIDILDNQLFLMSSHGN
ncbi:hypothetical protein [Clostridium sp.]|uniref:hypothetical protein n=1 Tax=Clostridium sp. TaxID=1506 RepID=UPI0026097C00|nr:hypothetical protein [Clostridium sp.]